MDSVTINSPKVDLVTTTPCVISGMDSVTMNSPKVDLVTTTLCVTERKKVDLVTTTLCVKRRVDATINLPIVD